MNSTKDIKVTFLDNGKNAISEKIRVFFKDMFNNDIQIDLRPGEIVYSQTGNFSNSLRIYSKKGIINIKEEKKPEFLNYYVGYKQEEIDNKLFLSNLKDSLKKSPEEQSITKTEIPKSNTKQKKELSPSIADKEIEPSVTNIEIPETKVVEKEDIKTIVDKAIENVSEYSLQELAGIKKKRRSRKGPGRPKKRGPKKGSKRKKVGE